MQDPVLVTVIYYTILESLKTKNPRVLILGSLKFAVYVLLYTAVSRTLRISGVRSNDDRLPALIDNQ